MKRRFRSPNNSSLAKRFTNLSDTDRSLLNLQPTLSGELLKLRPLRDKDFDKLYEAASDPLVWEQHPQYNRYKLEVFKALFNKLLEAKGTLIIETLDGRVIGSSTYYEYEPNKSRIVIGYTFIAREFWGGKFNGELKSLMLRHAFEKVDTVHFHIGRDNKRSRRAIEKIGAVLIDESAVNGQIRVTYEIKRAT